MLEKIYSIVSRHREEIARCKAILIEDDLDGRFFGCSASEIEAYNQVILHRIHEILEKEIPVFILYASPEAESWFVADWKNGFEYLYSDSGIVDDLDRNAKLFFVHHLKRYIDNNILKQYVDDIEEYGWFEGEYIKLSDELITAVQVGVKEYIRELSTVNHSYVEQIIESRKLYYSKKLHGDRMLRNIQPDIVARKCNRYFGSVYKVIRSF